MLELVVGVVKAGLSPMAGLVSRTLKFETTLNDLQCTIDLADPVVKRLTTSSDDPDDQIPKAETKVLIERLEEAKELVRKRSQVPMWKGFKLPFYQEELQEMDQKLRSDLDLVLKADEASTVKGIIKTAESSSVHANQFEGLCAAPAKPDHQTIGLRIPFDNLKKQLLQSGSSVSVLTGLGGFGKTTLATLLCWDEDVRGKFGENIFFITVSENGNLEIIVEALFKHSGWRYLPNPGRHDHPVTKLKFWLSEIGKNPLMLVLDDVWSGSEALIKAFQIELPHYKVLVTSRTEFPGFNYSCRLEPLCDEDAVILFRHFAIGKQNDGRSYSYIPEDDVVKQVARGCRGIPLVLEVIGSSLNGQPFLAWDKMKKELSKGLSPFESNISSIQPNSQKKSVYDLIQKCLDVLEDKSNIEECEMDLALFPEDKNIPVAALIDIGIELYENVEDDTDAMLNVHALTKRHLAKLVNKRNLVMSADAYYNNYFLKQHDVLKEGATKKSRSEPFEQRKRLIINLSRNNRPEWWVAQNQQGIIARTLSFFMEPQQVAARTMSISTDETFTSDWCNLQPDELEALILNLQSSNYSVPDFTKKMNKLKVLIVTNYGFQPSELNKFELFSSLSELKRIRLEKISVPCLCELRNLRKLSLHMCSTRRAFDESSSIKISDALPNLVEMNIDYCHDLVELPSAFCEITRLEKLNITNCHKLTALPQEIRNLKKLELLRLSSCSDLLQMPKSVKGLDKLRCIDLSDCIRLAQLPEDIGDLLSLQRLYLKGCSKLSELPSSVLNFEHMIYMICDDEKAALWKHFNSLPHIRIEIRDV